MSDPGIADLVRLAREMTTVQAQCVHRFRKIPSRIVAGTYSWKCTACGQMRHQEPRPPDDQVETTPEFEGDKRP